MKAAKATGNAQQLYAARTRAQQAPLTVFAQNQLIINLANIAHPLHCQEIRRTPKTPHWRSADC